MLVDAGAERALREQGTSLLPVGVVEVEGEFEAGDAVDVASAADGTAHGRQGDHELLGRGAAPGEGAEVGARCARCCRARARRPCTATTSCWPDRRPRYAVLFPMAIRTQIGRPRSARGRRRRSHELATLDTADQGRRAARRSPHELEARVDEIIEANAGDLEDGRAAGLDDALIDRLTLDAERVQAMADGVRDDRRAAPTRWARSSRRARSPTASSCARCACRSGVVAIVYEARPNVTVDAAALAIKSGNAVVLRGSSTAERSNAVLARDRRRGGGGRRACRRARCR